MSNNSNNNVKTLKPHVSIKVRDIEASVDFYQRLFGIEPLKFIKGNAAAHSISPENIDAAAEKPRAGYAKFNVQHPPLNLALNEVPYPAGGALSHLGIQVESTDDVLKTRERWMAEGLLTFDEMQVDCCYALQDKTWARDPDGNEWEVFVVLDDTEGKDNGCACGVKTEQAEVSASDRCAETANLININRSTQTCC